MSDQLFEAAGLYVTQYVGPAETEDRRRWQFTIAGLFPQSLYVSLDAEQVAQLADLLQRSLERRVAESHSA